MNAAEKLQDCNRASGWTTSPGKFSTTDFAALCNDLAITGLTSNPTIFDEAIGGTAAYDSELAAKQRAGLAGEALFIELALEDLRRAADIFKPVHKATAGMDGWVSMEVSPLLADDSAGTIEAAQQIQRQAGRENLYVKIPGTKAGIAAIEESIYRGVPMNVTLLFSREQYLAAAQAYLKGIERDSPRALIPGSFRLPRCSSAAGIARSRTRFR